MVTDAPMVQLQELLQLCPKYPLYFCKKYMCKKECNKWGVTGKEKILEELNIKVCNRNKVFQRNPKQWTLFQAFKRDFRQII